MIDISFKPIPKISNSDIKRFWSKVVILDDNNCWEWIGGKRRRGYGVFSVQVDKKTRGLISHRVSYFLKNNIDPADKIVLHNCDNTSCVNPNHLSLGTHKDNTNDMMSKGRGRQNFLNGELHKMSKLSNEDVVNIRKLYSITKLTQKQIGESYGIDGSHVSLIVNKKAWKHI